MIIGLLSLLVAFFLGFGAAQEFLGRGVRGGEVQPLWVGLAGIVVSLLLALSGIALRRQWPSRRRLVIFTAIASIAFHVYAALPPHRNVGLLALLIGAGYGVLLLGIAFTSGGGRN